MSKVYNPSDGISRYDPSGVINSGGAAPVTTFVNTIFNEGSLGDPLFGTTPAICTDCTSAWALSTAFKYGVNTATSSEATAGVFTQIATGHADGTVRFSISSAPLSASGCELKVRGLDANNYIYIYMNTDGTAIFNVVAGSQTQLGSTLPGTVFEGDYTIVLNGASVSMTCPNGVISGTTTLTNGTIMGMNLFSGATPPYTLTAFSVKSA